MKRGAGARTSVLVACAGLLALHPACSSSHSALVDENDRPLRDVEPVAYRIAVAPFQVDPAITGDPKALTILRGPQDLQSDLVAALAEMDASSEVFALRSATSYDAYREKADLLVLPRLEEMSSSRRSDRALLSSLLWFTTWIGSLWVEDVIFGPGIVISYELIDPNTGASLAGGVKARSGDVNLSFWERNRAFSKGFFLTLIMPPFLVEEEQRTAGRSIAHRSAPLIAAQIKSYLLKSLPAREMELLAQVQIQSPRNGSRVRGKTSVQFEIIAKRPITEARIIVNDELRKAWTEAELPPVANQEQGGLYRCSLREEGIELPPSTKCLLRVLVNVAGQWVTRSIALKTEATSGMARSP